jgi:hypothetical protein
MCELVEIRSSKREQDHKSCESEQRPNPSADLLESQDEDVMELPQHKELVGYGFGV